MNEDHIHIHHDDETGGIQRSIWLERQQRARYVVSTGLKCGHECLYCPFGALGPSPASSSPDNPRGFGHALVNPSMPRLVACDARRIKNRGMVQLGGKGDLWAPEARHFAMADRCLKAILGQRDWTVRITTKSTAVLGAMDYLMRHRDRAIISLSLTAPIDKEHIVSLLEPEASRLADRYYILREANKYGLRTFADFMPLLPGIADDARSVDELIRYAVACRAEEIFVQPWIPDGRRLALIKKVLKAYGYNKEAEALAKIRNRAHWSNYVGHLLANVQASVRRYSEIGRLRFLLPAMHLMEAIRHEIERDDAGVVWL